MKAHALVYEKGEIYKRICEKKTQDPGTEAAWLMIKSDSEIFTLDSKRPGFEVML